MNIRLVKTMLAKVDDKFWEYVGTYDHTYLEVRNQFYGNLIFIREDLMIRDGAKDA